MKFNKLVRDKIGSEIWDSKFGKNPKIHVADDKEYYRRLKDKLLEEIKEFLKDDNLKEIADILEVLYAIEDFKGVTREQIENLRKQIAEKNGAFKKRIILEDSED